MTDENKPINYRTLSELYAAYNSGVAFEVTDSEGTYPETYPVTGMSLTEDAAGLYVFAKTSTFPHVPWSVFLPDGSLEDHSFLHLRHSPEPTQPVTEPAPAQAQGARQPLTDVQIAEIWIAMPIGENEPREAIDFARAIEAAHGFAAQKGDAA